ncbi:MAG: CBS domain-containing protein [Thermodesulfobacteriota bacterium]
MSLESLCRREIVCVDVNTRVLEATEMMEEMNVGSVVVIQNDRPVGIVTDRDVVLRVVNKKLNPAECSVGDIMSLEVVTLKQSTGLYDALEQIKESGSSVRRFPIVDDNGAIKGIITLDDVIYLLGREMSDVASIIESERPRL